MRRLFDPFGKGLSVVERNSDQTNAGIGVIVLGIVNGSSQGDPRKTGQRDGCLDRWLALKLYDNGLQFRETL